MALATGKRELEDLGQAGACRVVVAYEDAGSRNSAVQLCDRVFQRFNGDIDFEADWWAFKFLGSPELGERAVGAAADSDLFIVSANSRGEFSLDIKYWFERWLSKLSSGEHPQRALVSLVLPLVPSRPKESYLQGLALRANLDYLPLGNATPETASRTLSVVAIKDFADHRYHIPHWGINE